VPLRIDPNQEAICSATTDKLEQYGITWTFDAPVKYGKFVNGDLWVLAPVTIKDVSPGWDGQKNGSVLDPKTSTEQGYRVDWTFSPKFNDDLRAKFPLKVDKGTHSLVSTIGLETPKKGGAYEGLEAASVLTIVDAVPAKDAFRPPYVAGNKPIYTKSQLRWNRLPKLKLPEGAKLPNLHDEHLLKRVWLDHYAGKGNSNSTIHPEKNMEPYAGYSARDASTIELLVLLDIPQREELTCRLVQYGIDLYAISLENKDAWRGYGGFGEGRKWPILFAGIMLSNDKMQHPPRTAESSNSVTGTVEKFGEDSHTYYGKPTADYPKGKPLWGNEVPGNIFQKLKKNGVDSGGDKDARDPEGLEDGLAYREICSVTYIGEALAARLMGAEKIWNHPAFFDYTDRWVKEGGSTVGSPDYPRDTRNAYQKAFYCYGGEFHKAMWETYRPKAEEIAKSVAPK
jgi:hypothetical protein